MKNILSDKPTAPLNPRLTESVRFVEDCDVNGKTMLDIGCGYGWFENNVLLRGVKRVDGIEITKADLATVKDNISEPRAHFRVAGALDLPFPDDYFDTVACWEVIEHIPKTTEPQMFLEIARVIKPGGHLYLSTPFASWPSKIMDPAWWLIGHRHYSADSLTKFGVAVGMKAITINRRGGYWSLTNSLNMYISKWILRRGPVFKATFSKHEFNEYNKNNGNATIFVKYELSEIQTP